MTWMQYGYLSHFYPFVDVYIDVEKDDVIFIEMFAQRCKSVKWFFLLPISFYLHFARKKIEKCVFNVNSLKIYTLKKSGGKRSTFVLKKLEEAEKE
jgi:hypothetical protein